MYNVGFKSKFAFLALHDTWEKGGANMIVRHQTTLEFNIVIREQLKERKTNKEISIRRESNQRREYWNSFYLKKLFN